MDALLDSVMEKGVAKGKEEGKREMVLRMVEEGGVSVAWIARVSGLTADEVLDIARDAGVSPRSR